jgi:hypothetical protein
MAEENDDLRSNLTNNTQTVNGRLLLELKQHNTWARTKLFTNKLELYPQNFHPFETDVTFLSNPICPRKTEKRIIKPGHVHMQPTTASY